MIVPSNWNLKPCHSEDPIIWNNEVGRNNVEARWSVVDCNIELSMVSMEGLKEGVSGE